MKPYISAWTSVPSLSEDGGNDEMFESGAGHQTVPSPPPAPAQARPKQAMKVPKKRRIDMSEVEMPSTPPNVKSRARNCWLTPLRRSPRKLPSDCRNCEVLKDTKLTEMANQLQGRVLST